MRKRWSTTARPGAGRRFHDSKAATYRWVQEQADLWVGGILRHQFVNTWFDDRDGKGWRLYERIDLADIAERGEPR